MFVYQRVEEIQHKFWQPPFWQCGNFLNHHDLRVMTLTMLETVLVIGNIAWTKQLPMTMRIRLCKSMQRNKIQQSHAESAERIGEASNRSITACKV